MPCAGLVIDGIATCDNPRNERFQRQVFSRSAADLKAAEANFKLIVRDVELNLLLERFRMHTSFCGMYGGCHYRPLCQDEEVGMATGKFVSLKEKEK